MAEHAPAVAEHHDHEHHIGHAPADPESIRKEKNVYFAVFAGLAVLTLVTVLISRVDFGSRALTIFIALAIAVIKGALVAGFFMHLLHERKFIYSVLALTVFFFGVLLWGPWHHNAEMTGEHGHHGAVEVTTTGDSKTDHSTGH